ncbi:SHOCT domain-containing protein [Amycolatopsis anabasis]|uniref:SHOCT domain-containing protein n=1 Tax=Amycolatopsis anabasis TaxID=1840409 RepID=UPI00131C70B2|nr:SHOCT domain-containing protein [Amycolatopsis anabasis]
MPHWYYDGNGTWFGGLFMLISMILLWGGLITIVIIVLRRYAHPPQPRNEALRILDERFARGEIDLDEYEQRRATLKP